MIEKFCKTIWSCIINSSAPLNGSSLYQTYIEHNCNLLVVVYDSIAIGEIIQMKL